MNSPLIVGSVNFGLNGTSASDFYTSKTIKNTVVLSKSEFRLCKKKDGTLVLQRYTMKYDDNDNITYSWEDQETVIEND